MGNFTVITNPVPWGQAENACGMIGLQLARIDINNFMDSTNIAFQCSGAQSQTWIKSWNGDVYAGTGLVLSTGNAAPGGAINEVNDGNVPRNVLCEAAAGPIVTPQCRRNKPCGCNHGTDCGCQRNRPERYQPKMKCLRCFCRRQVQCPLLGGGVGGPIPTVPGGRPVPTPGKAEGKKDAAKEVKKETVKEEKKEKQVKDVAKALGRFIQIGGGQKHDGCHTDDDDHSSCPDRHDSNSCSDSDNPQSSTDDEHSSSSSSSCSESEGDLMEMDKMESGEKGALEKSLPFYPATCGGECICYACERPRHHHRRHHGHHHHRVYDIEGEQGSDETKKAKLAKKIQQETGRQIAYVDLDGKFVEEKIAPQAKIAIQEHLDN